MRLGVEAALVDGELVRGDVAIEDGRIAAVGIGGGGRGVAVAGFVDLQVNGFGGVDFASADADGYRRAGAAMLASGCTSFQPTFITAPESALVSALASVPREPIGPRILGAHVEGPFLARGRLGAHPAAARRDPDPALLARLLDAGAVSQVTLAPELAGADELIALCQRRGVVVSLGHSDATAEQAAHAFDRGVGTVTHLFNAMRPFGHRDPGIVGCALARGDVTVQAILDGQHLARETAQVIWRAARGRLALVTDAIAAAGVGDGSYRLSGVDVVVSGGVGRLADGVLAGSTLTMVAAVRALHGLCASLPEAVAAATSVPARVARRPELGDLAPGTPADVVVLDDRLEVVSVLVDGISQLG